MSEKQTELTVIDGEGTDDSGRTKDKPLFHVVGGNPTEEELGAFTAVLSTLEAEAQKAATDERYKPVNNWGNLGDRLDRPQTYNPNAFRNSRYF